LKLPSNKSSSSLERQPFLGLTFLRKFRQICLFPAVPWISTSYFHFFGFREFFLQRKVIILASNTQPGGPGLCICVPSDRVAHLYPRHWVPFSSPSTTRKATVKEFYPASTREKLFIGQNKLIRSSGLTAVSVINPISTLPGTDLTLKALRMIRDR
jgi:hypothetical protein